KQLIGKLTRFGILQENATLDDVLALNMEVILSRRFQTLLYIKGLASTPKQARQLIVHGHAAISRRKVTLPGYLVRKNEESSITYSLNSPLNNEAHPVRPKIEAPGVKHG
ncbi:MAG: 30S ribosomal protein S4, partial [Euryarchaeota archaeon CG01_land_8_20_14_3_00_38_12]